MLNEPDQRTLVVGRASRSDDGTMPVLIFLLNPTGEARSFPLPPPPASLVLLDTAAPEVPDCTLV